MKNSGTEQYSVSKYPKTYLDWASLLFVGKKHRR